jgi:hypothetical protein
MCSYLFNLVDKGLNTRVHIRAGTRNSVHAHQVDKTFRSFGDLLHPVLWRSWCCQQNLHASISCSC